jgi:heterotetrameric sarcosine oxidase delta subunit
MAHLSALGSPSARRVHLRRRTAPSAIEDPDERDFDEVWIFENPDGPTTERWFHAFGCRRWLTVRRDTSIDVVLEIR